MKAAALALALVAQYAPWGAPAAAPQWTAAPWTQQAAPGGWGPYGVATVPQWSGASWGGKVPSGASETDPIVIPLSTDIQGIAGKPVYYAAYVPTGAAVVLLWAVDADLDLSVFPASGSARAVSSRASPMDAAVLLTPEDPWVVVRIVPSEGASRFVVRVASAVVGEAPAFGSTGTYLGPAAASAPSAPAWWQANSRAQTPPGIQPPVWWGAPPPPSAPVAPPPPRAAAPRGRSRSSATASGSGVRSSRRGGERRAAASSPAASPSPSAAGTESPREEAAPPPPPPVPPPGPPPPPGAEPPGADAPPGVAGVLRPGAEASGAATADVYYAVRLTDQKPFVVSLEMEATADLDLVVWASNGSRSWESAKSGSAAEEVTVEPVTDGWYIVHIAPRAAGRYTIRIRSK